MATNPADPIWGFWHAAVSDFERYHNENYIIDVYRHGSEYCVTVHCRTCRALLIIATVTIALDLHLSRIEQTFKIIWANLDRPLCAHCAAGRL